MSIVSSQKCLSFESVFCAIRFYPISTRLKIRPDGKTSFSSTEAAWKLVNVSPTGGQRLGLSLPGNVWMVAGSRALIVMTVLCHIVVLRC